MSIDEAIEELKAIPNERLSIMACEARDMAIQALEKQKELAELKGYDIYSYDVDYDYEEEPYDNYQIMASVDSFLIDELKEVE